MKDLLVMKYAYPVVIHQSPENETWKYWAEFPDLEGCYTEENTLPDIIEMARDAACLWLTGVEDDNTPVPEPSIGFVPEDKNAIVTLIDVDTTEYRKINDNRAVKKTLSIPNWLNVKAERAGVNFSQILQDGLKKRLNIA
jgi:predicted RNase H-like HicB family nuclease